MLRTSNKVSTVISMILTILLFFALCALAVCLPMVVDSMIDTPDNIGNRASITATQRALVLADAYTMIAVAFAAVAFLLCLLRRVLHGQVFSDVTVRLIASVSWCCFGEALLFLLIGAVFQLAFGVAIAACCLGVCLRVVKNVIAEATRIKSENDFTI